jgi:dihydrofolate reductase
MRTITYGGAVSLDGFLAGPNEELDWLHFSKDVQAVMAEYWKDVDAVLMGRKSYEFAAEQHRGGKSPKSAKSKQSKSRENSSKETKAKERKAPVVRTYVFSRTLQTIDAPAYELVREDAVEFVRNLKQQQGKEICLMGGGELAQSLLAANLVDEIGLNIHPILLGSGIPTFRDPGHRVKMTLKECRQIDGGCILAKYQVQHAK